MVERDSIEAVKVSQTIQYKILNFVDKTESFWSDIFEMAYNTKCFIRVEPKKIISEIEFLVLLSS